MVEVTVACPPAFSLLPSEHAMRSGIDQDHGLDLTCVQAASGPEISASLIAGETVIAPMVSANIFALLEQDVDVVAFLAVLDRETGDLIVRPDFPLPNSDEGWEGVMRDLRGATIGVMVRGAAAEDLARGLFIAAGLDPDQATYIATGGPTTTFAALDNGEIDAAITLEPGITLALEERIAVQPFSIQELTGPPSMDWASAMYVVTRDYAEQNTDVLVRFTRMWREALEWIRDPANRADAVELTSDYLGLDLSIAEVLFDRNLNFWSNSLQLEPDRFDPVGDFYRDIGRFRTAYHVADYGFDIDE
jgi:NitT/TauT family transport system substrate-binding protein